jgi:putative colanic acid biosynthesis UDP-glucose lipid carrier transferase
MGRAELLGDSGHVGHALRGGLDLLLIALAHGIASWAYANPWQRDMSSVTVLAIAVFSVFAQLCGLYRPWRSARLVAEARTVALSWMLTAAALVFVVFAAKTSAQYSRVVTFGWFLLAPLLLVTWRAVGRTALHALRASGRNQKTVAILGATQSADLLCAQIGQRPWLGMRIAGVYDDRSAARRHAFVERAGRYRGTEQDLIAACRRNEIDIVYIALPLRAEQRIADSVRALADTTVTVQLLADFFTYELLCAHWGTVGDFPVISIHDTPFRGIEGGLKRLEDIIVGSLILLLISVPMLVIALLVKLTSPGPILFRQKRYGLNGKEIRILKFRSMTVCEDGPRVEQARRNDSRVTALGRFLRRTSLDELPQFLQVLTGEMSIVGPRPHAVAHNEEYRALIHGYMLRHKVRPGITGWAQVNGWRGETPDISWMEKRVAHDLEYIEKWSLLWDLKIILLTVLGAKARSNAF